jgi:hypothetical protein
MMPKRQSEELPRDAHETTLTIDHDRQVVYVWTDNRRIANKLRKIGAKMTLDGKAWWRFEMPESYVGIRKRRASGGFARKPVQIDPSHPAEGDGSAPPPKTPEVG